MFSCTLLYVHSGVAIILMGVGERAGCFAWFVFLVSRGGWAALPRGAMGLSAVCDCGFLIILTYYFYRYHKIRKAFSKFYRRHSELIVK